MEHSPKLAPGKSNPRKIEEYYFRADMSNNSVDSEATGAIILFPVSTIIVF